MKKKVMKGLPKRIAAFTMAILMLFSLMPIDPSVVLAADEYTFTLTVKGSDPAVTLNETDVAVYEIVDDVRTLVATGTTSDEGVISVSGLTFEDEKSIANEGNYEFVCYGYKTASVTVNDTENTEKEYTLELEAYPTITVSGTINLPDEKMEGVENAYASINEVELLYADGTAVKADETPVTAEVDDATGAFSFSEVLAGYEYKIKITSTNNTYDEAIYPIDLKEVENDYDIEMDEYLAANEELTLEFSNEDVYEVYIAGTQKTFAPVVKNSNDEDVTTGYEIEYSIDSSIQNVTVGPDGNQHLVVQATEGAVAGPLEVIATLTGADYVTVSTTVIVQIKEKVENSDFNFKADGITDGGEYEVDYAPDGSCSFDATADIKDAEGNSTDATGVTYAVVAGDDVLSIDPNTGAITINKVGTATITATLPAIDDYLVTTVELKLTVKPIAQTNDVEFKGTLTPSGDEVTYVFGENSNTYNFEAGSDEENVTITYSVTCNGINAVDAGKASINGADVTFNQAGTYVVTATATKENYISSTVSYTVNITKADLGLYFATEDVEGYTENVINGKYLVDTENPFDFVEAVLKSDKLGDAVNNGVTYSENSDLIEIDSNTGEITFVDIKDASAGDVEITITATRAEDESYEEKTITYTFKVVDWEPTVDESFAWEDVYEITGISNNGWFTKVDAENPITVAIQDDLPYVIFADVPTKDTVDSGITSFAITDLDDGVDNEISFYLMDAADTGKGYISTKHTINNIKVDEITPSISCIKQGEATFVGWLIYFFTGETVQNEFVVEVEETVTTSELKKYYYISDSATVMTEDEYKAITKWIEITDETEIKIPVNSQSVIYAKVCDEAGNTAYAHTKGLIADNTAPEIVVTTPVLLEIQNGYYKEDFAITVDVTEQANLSGISKIVYWLGEKTGEGTELELFPVDASTTVGQLDYSHSEDINIIAADYNTVEGVTVYIEAVDNAGNKAQFEENYKICIEEPTISVVYYNDDVKNTVDGIHYYDAECTATVTINSRSDVFKTSNAVIKVDGQTINNTWDGQSVEVGFKTNGLHTFTVEYTNTIGDVAEVYSDTFWIDTDAPTGVATLKETSEPNAWDELLTKLTFGIWKKATATVTATANTDTTAVTMQYYISNTDTILTTDALNALAADKWTAYTSGAEISITDENIYAVYFKLTDVVGHVTYLSTDGFIVDMNGSTVAITPTVEANANGYYNADVELNVTVTENISGIKSVEYWIMCGDVETEHQTLYTFTNNSPTINDLSKTYNNKITVDALENNSANVTVYVKVIDNAGYETTTEHALKINATVPTVDISYDNNNATGHDGGVNYFFDALRTATITITDRADTFDATVATNAIIVELKDKIGNTVADNGVTISNWTTVGDKHTATVAFIKDGYYTLDVDYTNKAGISNENVNPAQSTVGALAFVIDTTNPVNVTVSALSNTWDELLEAITFGLYTSNDVVLTITGEDVTSAATIEYYIANDGQAKTVAQLEQIADNQWTTYTSAVTISEEQQMAVFVRVTDQAGNRTYVNSKGIVLDKTAAGITLTPEAANTNGVYNSDVDVKISVDDSAITSGIKTVEYWITCDGTETERATLYTFSNDAPVKGDLLQSYNETITVDAAENNSSNVVVYVKVTDNAGNTDTKSVALDIDITAPTIEVSYDNNTTVDLIDGKGYFDAIRTATIVVTERTAHFDKEAFMRGVVITAKDFKGNDLTSAVPTVEFIGTTEGDTADAEKHTFKVAYSADANYTLAINYTDKAGWVCADSNVEYDDASVAPQNFSIDTTAPTGKITVGSLGFWEELLSNITFGLWSPSDVDIIITADDATSPVKSIEYYKTPTFTALSKTDLEAITEWVAADRFTVLSDDIFVVYAKITDQTGHVQYISSNGIIVDENKPVVETLSPEITITPERPVNGIYDGNVRVDVGVVDPKAGVNNACSGLRTIRYEIYNMGSKTQEGTLYSFSESNPTQDKLLQSWNDQDIVVEAAKNNSNDVLVKVIATDNAGNQSVATTTLKIDITAPKIEVSYDNNNGDASFEDGVYYNANRVATIKVTERNFDASAVKVTITNTDGAVPTISKWTTKAGTGNGDDTVYTVTIVYAEDGDYTFAISAKDKVGNANSGVNYGDSQAPTAFTIDKTVPVISVAYDNNDFANENYYKANRTATITINEHNFDASRVVATITATDNGQPVTAPTISNWSKSGDTYTATVSYATDALYTFDIAYSDKAKNQAVDFAEQSFYVDKTIPQLSITEIVDQSANNKDKIGFVITATDTNFDVFNPVLTAVVKTENGFITQELNIASISDITNGRVYTISNIDADGIYRITCTLVDKAGNAYTEVTLHQADGTPYVESRNAEDTLLTFSVNRDGSVFEVDEATKEILDNYYVHDVTEDIVIIEVNANRLTTNNVTLNGKELIEGTDFTVSTEGGNGAWLRYIYTLNKELFVEEGEYTIVVSSVDEAENNAFSDVKNAKVAFVVDRTAPVVTISGLETNGKYQTENQKVTLIPTDDGGEVKSIVVNQVDEEGNVVKTLLEELSGEALADALAANDGQISFNIPSGEYDYIEIVCTDYSVNSEGDTNTVEILIKNVLITESELELIWATYQYAIIAGVVAVIAVPTGIVLFRRRVKAK